MTCRDGGKRTLTYDADGNRVKRSVTSGGPTTTTYYLGNYFEVNGSTVTKYYYLGDQRVAMSQNGAVYYLHGDHLGSTNVVSGAAISQQTHYAYGLPRTSEGTLPTDYAFTGQRQDSDGSLYYGARYYEASLNRWIQPDSVVPQPGNPQSLNRYSYAFNNPVNLVDPSGHAPQNPGDPDDMAGDCTTDWCWENRWYAAHGYNWDNGKSDWVMPNTPNPRFYDDDIADAVIGEAGISLNNPSSWSSAQRRAVATGIAWFGAKLSGHIPQLRELIGGSAGVVFGDCFGSPCAPPSIFGAYGNTIFLPSAFLPQYGQTAPMMFVHELTHLIDWHSSIGGRKFSEAWHGAPITNYATTGSVQPADRFAEAVAVFVFGVDYSKYAGSLNMGPGLGDQMTRIQALLEGWY